MTIQEIYALPVEQYGWRVLPSGNRVKLGDWVTLVFAFANTGIATPVVRSWARDNWRRMQEAQGRMVARKL